MSEEITMPCPAHGTGHLRLLEAEDPRYGWYYICVVPVEKSFLWWKYQSRCHNVTFTPYPTNDVERCTGRGMLHPQARHENHSPCPECKMCVCGKRLYCQDV